MTRYVSDIVRELREKRGWSLRELGAKSDVNFGTISRIESGASEPKPESLIALAKALGVDPQILLDAPVKSPNTVDIQDALKNKNVEVLLGGKKLSASDRKHVLELIQLARKLSDE